MHIQGMSSQLQTLLHSFNKDPKFSNRTAKAARQVLKQLQDELCSYSCKAGICNGLTQTLSKLYEGKSYYNQFCLYLGFGEAAERELQSLYSESISEAKRYTSFDEAASAHLGTLSKQPLTPEDELCLMYNSMLASSPVKIKELNRPLSLSKQVAPWMLDHLIAFQNTLGAATEAYTLCEKLIQELKDHLVIGCAQEELRSPSFWSFFPKHGLDWTVHEILHRIHTLKAGREFVMPGSSAKEDKYPDKRGQLVEYVIQRQANNAFSFQIVNVRIGSKQQNDRDRLFAHLFGSYAEERALTKMQDYIWTNIPQEAFTQACIKLLLDPVHHKQATTSMTELTGQIRTHLGGFRKVKEGTSSVHGGPIREDVALKTMTTWLHQRMQNTLWAKFKLFYSEREVQKLPLLLSQHPIPKNAAEYMQSEATAVLGRRQAKLAVY